MAKHGSTKAIIQAKPGTKARFDEPFNMKERDNQSNDGSKKGLAKFLAIKARQEDRAAAWNHSNICPVCHLVLCKTGECPKCGNKYQVKKAS